MLSITTNFEFVKKLFLGHLRENAVGNGRERFAQERAIADQIVALLFNDKIRILGAEL